MDTVGKVAGKVAKFADDYKVRVVTLAMARATPRGAAPRAIDHSRRRNPTRSQTLTPSPPSRPPVSTQDYFHYGLIRHHRHRHDHHAPAQPLPAPHPV